MWRQFVPLVTLLIAVSGTAHTLVAQQRPLPPISQPSTIGPAPPVGTGGCSVTAPTCADVAPTIIRSALGPTSIEDNLRFLIDGVGSRVTGSPAAQRAVQWAIAAFRKAGVDEVHAETYELPNHVGGRWRAANVVAEIHGRDKPSEFVVLGAHLDSRGPTIEDGCNAAIVVDAARAIHAAGSRPSRSIRFILFTGEEQGMLGSWAYIRQHRLEMDRADAVVVFEGGRGRVTGYELSGRRDIETNLREALGPATQFGADKDTYSAGMNADNFDFLLEGVPTLVANHNPANRIDRHAGSRAAGKIDIAALKRQVALVALTAYGIADLPQRLGPRQTRPEVEQLLDRTGLGKTMKARGIWPLWEQGSRGRQPDSRVAGSHRAPR